jgi:hypothetical protein
MHGYELRNLQARALGQPVGVANGVDGDTQVGRRMPFGYQHVSQGEQTGSLCAAELASERNHDRFANNRLE